ncbi:hypothetical protein BHE74_00045366 [Ensete ventricosum]|nr:hypothetical protein BHE74_00045366 [Ensete ventricosum]
MRLVCASSSRPTEAVIGKGAGFRAWSCWRWSDPSWGSAERGRDQRQSESREVRKWRYVELFVRGFCSLNEPFYGHSLSLGSLYRLEESAKIYSMQMVRKMIMTAYRSSPPPVLRSTTPSQKSSAPLTKPSSLAQRSLTPILRRMSTGSSRQAFTGRWGTSPVKTNRGSSASPKLHGWQTNLPGFSTDVPPNLQTSLTDRSASRVRDLSPASVNGIGFGPKFGRQSISPYSRSVRFSHDSEGDCFSFISKPSAASSFEDDVESHSPVRVSTTAATIKYRDFANARAMQFSKKISRVTSANSAPKRSFDSALRKMVICISFFYLLFR